MKRTLKIVGIVILVIVVLVFGVQWWLGNKIKHTLEEKLVEQTHGAMQVNVGSVDVRLIGRTVHIKDVRIMTDSTRAVPDSLPIKYVEGKIREISLSGIHYKKEDSLVNIRARKLSIDIDTIQMNMLKQKSVDEQKPAGQKLRKQEMQLQLDEIEFLAAALQCRQIQPGDTADYQLKRFRCRIEDCRYTTVKDSTALPVYCEDLRLSFDRFRNRFAKNTQLLAIDSLAIRGKEGVISVGAVNLIPLYSKEEFALKSPGHTDWTKIQVGRISCYGFNMQRMMKEGILDIDSVEIDGAEIVSYKNRKIEQVKRVKRLFYESVQQFPVPLSVRQINANRINVEYQELAVKGYSPGTVTFNNLNGVFEGLTNRVTPHQAYFTLRAHGELMNKGYLQATFRLPVDSTNQHFEVDGSLGKMSMLALNPMIEPLVKIKITSGEIEDMTFHIAGNLHEAKVNMVFLYDDLKIRVMKEKDGHLVTRSFLTTLANGLIAKGNNPDHRGVRKAEGTAERDIYRSQFNYLWRTLLAGLKVSIGL